MSRMALTVEELTVTYAGGHRGLDGVGFEVAHGESLGVVGASGSGKTTLLRTILGLLPPGSVVRGRVSVDGHDLLGMSPPALRKLRGKVIGYVAQDPFAACDPLRSVRHHVVQAWAAHGDRPSEGRIDGGLAGIGIPEPRQRARQRPHQWSGGMLQRATTLAATVHDPVLTLADEPTSALDTDLADGALELLRSTCSALLVVTHDLAMASRHTDRIAVFHEGRIIERGTSAAVLVAPRQEVTRSLVRAASPCPRQSRDTATATEPVVRAEVVTKTYTGRRAGNVVTAVRPTSLELHPGQVTGIVGPSGSGKSTLLRLLAGMERPDAGMLSAAGRPVWGSPAAPQLPRKGFSMPVFQNPVGSLDPRWPVWRSITEPMVLAGRRLSRNERRERAHAELVSVGMDDVGVDRLPGSLSVGQCQRVAIVRALIAGPALLAADEPTASLDVETATRVSEMLRSAADRGAAVLVVSHDEPRLRSYANRIMRMSEGTLVDEG